MRLAIASDIHYPYHDPRAEGLFLSILPDLNLDGLMILGDAVDFEPISRFVTHPRHKLDLKPQIQEARKHFATIRKPFRINGYGTNRATTNFALRRIFIPVPQN